MNIFHKHLNFWTSWALGTSLAMLCGVFGFLSLLNYGGNYGCFAWIDWATSMQGYESCGYFGGFAGIFAGVLLGVFLLDRIVKSYREIVAGISLALAWVLPLAYGVLMGGLDWGISLAFLAFFMLLSGLSSAFLILSFKS